MRFARMAATAVLSTAALGIMAGTAHGEPAVANSASGHLDRGVGYTMSWAPDHSSATANVTSGKFALTANEVDVLASNGAVVDRMPLVYQVAGQQFRLSPKVNAAGNSLTVERPTGAQQQPSGNTVALRNVASDSQIAIGAAIGCGIGALIGLLFLIVGVLPGCIVGAIINGALVWNGQGIHP